MAGCRWLVLLVCALGAATALAASSTLPGRVSPMTVVDTLGRRVEIARTPERVIALHDSAYGQLAALGVKPVGASVYRDTRADPLYFAESTSIADIAGPAGIDGELLATLRPDLAIGTFGDLVLLEALSPVIETGALRSVEEHRENLLLLGQVLDRSEAAAAAVERFDRRLAAYRALAGAPIDVLVAGTRDGKQFLLEVGSNCALIDRVFRCRQEDTLRLQNWVRTSVEGLLARDPQVIVLSNWSGLKEEAYRSLLARTPLWNALRAVRDGRVIILDGYRFPDSLSLLKAAKLLDLLVPKVRPDAVAGPLTNAQVGAVLSRRVPDRTAP